MADLLRWRKRDQSADAEEEQSKKEEQRWKRSKKEEKSLESAWPLWKVKLNSARRQRWTVP